MFFFNKDLSSPHWLDAFPRPCNPGASHPCRKPLWPSTATRCSSVGGWVSGWVGALQWVGKIQWSPETHSVQLNPRPTRFRLVRDLWPITHWPSDQGCVCGLAMFLRLDISTNSDRSHSTKTTGTPTNLTFRYINQSKQTFLTKSYILTKSIFTWLVPSLKRLYPG